MITFLCVCHVSMCFSLFGECPECVDSSRLLWSLFLQPLPPTLYVLTPPLLPLLPGPALARPTTPLTAGALVPPPRPSSRPKLPTGKLSGINEIVSRTRWDGVFLYPGTV